MIIRPMHRPIQMPKRPILVGNIERSPRKSDQPVGNEIGEHGGARVGCAPQGSGGDGLEAVEQLECSGDQQELRAHFYYGRIGSEQAGDQFWNGDEDRSGAGHEPDSEMIADHPARRAPRDRFFLIVDRRGRLRRN